MNREEELNKRIYNRNIPSKQLESIIDFRSQHTKYNLFPLFDDTPYLNKNQDIHFDVNNTFTPGTTSPFYGYATKIDDESNIKNLFMANQRHAIQSHYIPSSNSDMYIYDINFSEKNIEQHPYLQNEFQFSPKNTNPHNIGVNNNFYIHTRQEIKNIK